MNGNRLGVSKALHVPWVMFIAAMGLALTAFAQDARQSLEDAWWTGPMLAPSAATLPRGHLLIEPYLYDVIAQG